MAFQFVLALLDEAELSALLILPPDRAISEGELRAAQGEGGRRTAAGVRLYEGAGAAAAARQEENGVTWECSRKLP
ncbi:hypothetical protein [Paenibacillus spongiae]|uniref:Uncharacterized protein n=1 Tax=Paenibacillus spongiae TaxID=2909671 RepID=A0ABY5S4W5_9BACL|nr:hypothetical protein [Paenibacillus spongiae]UVI28729.1 hypothetical protein L1F29_25305 [Paenibacillus spongiae]